MESNFKSKISKEFFKVFKETKNRLIIMDSLDLTQNECARMGNVYEALETPEIPTLPDQIKPLFSLDDSVHGVYSLRSFSNSETSPWVKPREIKPYGLSRNCSKERSCFEGNFGGTFGEKSLPIISQ